MNRRGRISMWLLMGKMGRRNGDELLCLHFEDRLFHIPSLSSPNMQQPDTRLIKSARTPASIPFTSLPICHNSLPVRIPLDTYIAFPSLHFHYHALLHSHLISISTWFLSHQRIVWLPPIPVPFTFADAPVPILPPTAPNSTHLSSSKLLIRTRNWRPISHQCTPLVFYVAPPGCSAVEGYG